MKYLKALALGAVMVAANPASAAVAIYTFNTADPAAGLGAGPYGTVTVTENAGALDFVLALTGGYRIHAGNANHPAFAFKVNGDPAVTISALTAGFASTNTSGGGSNQSSPPFGTFFTTIDCTTACGPGFGGGFTGNLSFKLSSAGALSLSSLGFNIIGAQNIYFTTDIVQANGNTGNVGATLNATPAVPEPMTWAMLLAGFGAVGFVLRRQPKITARVRFA